MTRSRGCAGVTGLLGRPLSRCRLVLPLPRVWAVGRLDPGTSYAAPVAIAVSISAVTSLAGWHRRAARRLARVTYSRAPAPDHPPVHHALVSHIWLDARGCPILITARCLGGPPPGLPRCRSVGCSLDRTDGTPCVLLLNTVSPPLAQQQSSWNERLHA